MKNQPIFLLVMLLLSCHLHLRADDNVLSRLAIVTKHGSVTRQLESLSMTISDGQITLNGEEGEMEIPAADLIRMYFTPDIPAAVSRPENNGGAVQPPEVYDRHGCRIKPPYHSGMYIMRENGVMKKVIIK